MMHNQEGTARRRTLAAVATLTLLSVLGLSASPAAGHDALLTSSPSEGQVVSSPPETLSMVFSAELMPDGAAVTVTDEEGEDWVGDELVIIGYELRAALRTDLPDGEFEVRWRVVSSDGHPISDVFSFTIDRSSGHRAEKPAEVQESADPAAAAPHEDRGRATQEPDLTWLVVMTTAVMVLGLSVIIALVRRRSSR